MITTTLAVVALAGALGAGASPSPGWQTNYAQAMTLASAEHKPIAVFIGQGGGNPGKMIADGTIPSDAAKLLRDSYVCVYLDTDTAAGKAMAGRFALSVGLVISSPGGSVQALRHSGTVGGSDLTQKLTRYATASQPATTVSTGGTSPTVTVTGPVTVGTPVTSPFSAPGGCVGGNCRLGTPTVGSYIVPSAPAYPFGGSSCPNGQCPLQR